MKKGNTQVIVKIVVGFTFFILLFSFFFSCENHWIIELTDHMYPELHEPVVVLTHIEADYNQTGTVYTFTPRDSLKDDLLVKAFFNDGTFITVDAADYTLSGTLGIGTNTITVSYGGKTVEFEVEVFAITISAAEITVTFPVTGEAPVTTASSQDAGYAYSAVTWTRADGAVMDAVFQGSTEYRAEVTLAADAGYIFAQGFTAEINDLTALASNNTGGNVTVSYTFAATSAAAVAGISIQTQPGLSYTHGDALDLSALVVRVDYDGGSTEDVPFADFEEHGITAVPAHGTALSRISHNGQSIAVALGANHAAATGNLTVAQAVPGALTPPQAGGITYGAALSASTLTGGSTDGAWTWQTPSTIPTVTNTGYLVVFAPDDTANYNWTGVTTVFNISITVAKANPAYTVPTGLTAVYGQTLADVTLPAGWSWMNASTPVGDAGSRTHKAKYTPSDTANYNYIEDIDVTVTVAPPDGSPDNPFIITAANAPDVIGPTGTIHSNLDKHYRLEADVVLTPPAPGESNWTPIGADYGATLRFNGTFDGNGHTITGLSINAETGYQGMFGVLGSTGVVKNLGLVDVDINGGTSIGSIVGFNYGGTIENSYATGTVISTSTNAVGGLVGNNQGTVKNSYAVVNVSGRGTQTGGLVGVNTQGAVAKVENSYAAGSVSGYNYGGGLVGYNTMNTSTVHNSVALNPVIENNGTGTGTTIFGRVTGSNLGDRDNNYGRVGMALPSGIIAESEQDGIHGADVSATENAVDANGGYHDIAFWQDTMRWDFDDVWEWNYTTNLPILRGVGGAQDHKVTTIQIGGVGGVDISSQTGANILEKAINYINTTPGEYTLVLDGDITVASVASLPRLEDGVSLTLVGTGGESTITREGTGTLFSLGNRNNVSLTIGNNITLTSSVVNTSANPLIWVTDTSNNVHITMLPGSKITGHTTNYSGGVAIISGATNSFTMNGGEISGNHTTHSIAANAPSGGVAISGGATFTMNGGTITGNTRVIDGVTEPMDVLLRADAGDFTRNGGTIGTLLDLR